MSNGASTLSTELHAIHMALTKWDREDLVIHTDSLGSIQKLSNGPTHRPLARQIQLAALDRQDWGLLTILHSIPSHMGFRYNDRVDALAKEAALIPTPRTRTGHQSKRQVKAALMRAMITESADRDESRDNQDLLCNPTSQSRAWNDLIRTCIPEVPPLPLKSWQSAATRFRIDYRRWGDIPVRSNCACGLALFSVAHVLVSCPEANKRATEHLGDPKTALPLLSERLQAVEVIRRASEEGNKSLALFCRDNRRLLW